MARAKRKRDVLTKYAGTRVNGEFDRWLTRHQKDGGFKRRSHVVLMALCRYRSAMERAKEEARPGVAACSCAPDDRALHGCKCAAGVGR